MENECRVGIYATNKIVLHDPIVCSGHKPIDQPQCKYFKQCAEEVIKPILTPIRWRNFQKRWIKQED